MAPIDWPVAAAGQFVDEVNGRVEQRPWYVVVRQHNGIVLGCENETFVSCLIVRRSPTDGPEPLDQWTFHIGPHDTGVMHEQHERVATCRRVVPWNKQVVLQYLAILRVGERLLFEEVDKRVDTRAGPHCSTRCGIRGTRDRANRTGLSHRCRGRPDDGFRARSLGWPGLCLVLWCGGL